MGTGSRSVNGTPQSQCQTAARSTMSSHSPPRSPAHQDITAHAGRPLNRHGRGLLASERPSPCRSARSSIRPAYHMVHSDPVFEQLLAHVRAHWSPSSARRRSSIPTPPSAFPRCLGPVGHRPGLPRARRCSGSSATSCMVATTFINVDLAILEPSCHPRAPERRPNGLFATIGRLRGRALPVQLCRHRPEPVHRPHTSR